MKSYLIKTQYYLLLSRTTRKSRGLIFRANLVNFMAADALAPPGTTVAVAITLAMWDKWTIVLHLFMFSNTCEPVIRYKSLSWFHIL